jgi:hypothetical protein
VRPDEAGQVAGIEVIPFGLLVFVVGALVVANVWAVFDAKTTATAAAREATRAYVEAPNAAEGDSAAHSAASDAVRAVGRNPARMTLRIQLDGGFVRCGRVTSEATYRVPFVRLPWIGGVGDGATVVGRHSEIVDPFRSEVPGEASCGARF